MQPSCRLTALALSGLPTQRFTFEGFLSVTRKSRMEHLDSLRGEKRTMIFYEAPHKLVSTLEDLCTAFGEDRPAALCRELTKLHEEVLRTTLGAALSRYRTEQPRGEFVLVVAGAPEEGDEPDEAAALDRVRVLREKGLSLRDAVRQAAGETGMNKNALYRLAAQDQE